MEIKQAFGIVLKNYRQKAQLSQEKLAFDCNLDRTYISLLERGKRRPTLDTIFALSRSLNVSPSLMVSAVESLIVNENSYSNQPNS
ncbi:MAG: helix-turn-helix transcriptional regulator [Candidatus Neomarinimicrobiota bacterium]|jgi:transcriptional regulator with XRE-family HTH domain